MAVDLIFFFDSEDYETPASDAGELWWADALTRHGLTGCFNLVGEEARALRDRGRRDVLAALARHEIGYHANLHSAHPVHVEYLEGMGWDDGVAAVLAREAPGVADVRELTGQQPATYCKPGSNWAPQVLAAMTLLGIPTFCDAPFEWAPGQPLWYCGSLCVGYHISFDRRFSASDRRTLLREDFGALLDRRRETGGVLVMYTHPCRLVTAAFPDNFTAGRNPPRNEWRPAPIRSRAEIEALKEDFSAFLRWVLEAGDVEPATYAEVVREHAAPVPWLSRDEMRELCAPDVAERAEPRRVGAQWLSPAEQLAALAAAALRIEGGGDLANGLAFSSPLGPAEP